MLDCLCDVIGDGNANRQAETTRARRFAGEILLAEDNEVNQEVAIGMLMTLGCSADIAEDGLAAAEKAQARRYDLILMDCHMPEISGFDASRRIREHEKREGRVRTPIVALTADVRQGIEAECAGAGMDGYLSKPFSQAKLAEVLEQWLEPETAEGAAGDGPAPAAGDADDAVLDSGVIEQLRELSKSSGRDILGDVAEMGRALSSGNSDTLGNLAHSLKSSSANLGASEFSRLCAELEQAARQHRVDSAAGLLPEIEGRLPGVLRALRREADVDPVAEDAAGAEARADLGKAATILVIDDDEAFRLTTCEALRGAGFRVDELASGEDVPAELEKSVPDLVLLDAVMPGVDGFEVCRQIRNRSDARAVPILMLTGLGDMESVNRAFESGATDFIVKPVNYAVLGSSIRFQLRTAEALRNLQISQEWLSSAQRVAGIGYWQWNASDDSFAISTQLADLLALGGTGEVGKLDDFIEMIHPKDREFIRNRIVTIGLDGESSSDDYRLRTLDSQTLVVHQELARPREPGDVVLGTVQDITRQRESEQRIRQLAYTDELTGLASRAYFHRHLEDAVKAAHRRRERFALLFLDLDGFKDVNDSLGHDAGDRLLQEIAGRLQDVLRETDFVARLGGDEFCIMVDNIDDQFFAANVASRCLEKLNQPITLGRQTLQPRCSIGIANYPEDGEDSKALLKAADSAMYAAKESGKHRYVFYQPEFTDKAEKRLRIEQDLRRTIENDELTLHYQPQIDLRTGRMVGVEALVRWIHPTRGMIPPGDFIDIAERTRFIGPMGEWVLGTACRQALAWRDMGVPHLRMAVNISASHFKDPKFAAMVERTLAETGFPGDCLELEITESVTQPTRENLSIFHRLKALGIKIAIDDFGTGYSSLASLKHLPIDQLKIDRSFIQDMIEDPKSSILLGTIVSAAHALGQSVVAEGVEQEDQVRVLSGLGCDMIQGYYFSRPVVADDIPPLAGREFAVGNGRASKPARAGVARAG